MKTQQLQFPRVAARKVLVLALMAVFGPVHADEDIDRLIKPDSFTLTEGVALSVTGGTRDRSLAAQYSGWADTPAALLLDIDYIQRDDDSGLWTTAQARNLGLNNREMRFARDLQGQWKFAVDYNEQVRRDPLTINTGMSGIGSSNPVTSLIGLGSGGNANLDVKRKSLNVSGQQWISSQLSLEANFKTETKDGTRLSGIGGYCSNAIAPVCAGAGSTLAALFLLPEPIKSNIMQLDGSLHYTNDQLALTAGYYGSIYTNYNNTESLGGISGVLGAGSTAAALASNLGQPLALSPDNEAHQVYLSGTYALQPTTRANFKLAFTHATQNDTFAGVGVGSLRGAVDSTLAQVGLTMRPLSQLSLNLSGRYEGKTDLTPKGKYLVDGSGTLYTNSPDNSQRYTGKAEALYQFSSNYRGLLGVDFNSVERGRPASTTYIPADSLAALREHTNEVGVRTELRRSMSDTVNAAIGVGHSERDGYRWYSVTPGSGFAFMSYASSAALGGTFPMNLVDRSRDSYKLSVDWNPLDALSIQASVDQGKDHFKGPTSAGLDDTDAIFYNVDASYKVDDDWNLTGYVSSGRQTLAMRQAVGYIANLTGDSNAVGLGATGKVNARLEVGGNLSFQEDRNIYKLGLTTGAPVLNPLPADTYRVVALKLYGKYALDKATTIQVDLLQQQVNLEDWAWSNAGVPFAYSDNTTVSVQPVQQLTYLGAKYVFRFK